MIEGGARCAASLPQPGDAMEYMLMFYETPEEAARGEDPQQAEAYHGAWMAYVGAAYASGAVKNGAGLQGVRTATTLRMQGGKRQVQDGPFADTREQLGGYFVMELPSLDAALEWAARAPCAGSGGVEVRPVMPVEQMHPHRPS